MPGDSRSRAVSAMMWNEWSASPVPSGTGAREEIGGILAGISALPDPDGGKCYCSARLWIFRRLKKLWTEAWDPGGAEFGGLLSIPPNMKGKVAFRVPADILAFLSVEGRGQEGLPSGEMAPPRHRGRAGGSSSPGRSWGMDWLKGLWGSCGSLYIPRSGYYLSFRIPSRDAADCAAALLRREGLSLGRRQVQGKHEITLRDQEEIVTLLARFHLSKTSLRVEEKAIFRSMRNRANQLVNCDAFNIRKSLDAASRQLATARSMAESPGFSLLPEVLKNLVYSRLSNPSATLEELGRMQEPPVSKSTVQYRWKKLEELVSPLRGTGPS